MEYIVWGQMLACLACSGTVVGAGVGLGLGYLIFGNLSHSSFGSEYFFLRSGSGYFVSDPGIFFGDRIYFLFRI